MTTAARRILITAGYGNQARALIPRLAAAGFAVRALRATDRPGPGPRELGAAEVVVGDATDLAVLAPAMQGIDAYYHLGPTFHPREREFGFNAIAAARAAGVRHFVFSSVLHPIASGLLQHAIKRDIEERLIESGLDFTILQPSDYMQTAVTDQALERGVFELPWDLQRRQALVDLDDVAQVVVKVLLEGKAHHGATYELSSDDCLSAHEIVATLGGVLGRPIRAVRLEVDELLERYFAGIDPALVAYQRTVLAALCRWYDRHDFVGNGNVLAMLLGRRPTSFAGFVARELARHRAG